MSSCVMLMWGPVKQLDLQLHCMGPVVLVCWYALIRATTLLKSADEPEYSQQGQSTTLILSAHSSGARSHERMVSVENKVS